MRLWIVLSAAMGVAGFCQAALAQGETAPPSTMMEAREAAMDLISEDLSHAEIGVLNLVAHAAAAASLCDALELDGDAASKAIDAATGEAVKESSDEAKARHHDLALMGYGVLVGLMIAEGSEDKVGFCADAVAMAKDPETAKFIKAN